MTEYVMKLILKLMMDLQEMVKKEMPEKASSLEIPLLGFINYAKNIQKELRKQIQRKPRPRKKPGLFIVYAIFTILKEEAYPGVVVNDPERLTE